VILTPIDFRKSANADIPQDAPAWTRELYEQIERELTRYSRRTP
jgi:hypothetical protein